MTDLRHCSPSTDRLPSTTDYADPAIVELVDALVEAVDLNRSWEIDRLRSALEPFGAGPLFDTECRLRGTPSTDEGCICGEMLR